MILSAVVKEGWIAEIYLICTEYTLWIKIKRSQDLDSLWKTYKGSGVVKIRSRAISLVSRQFILLQRYTHWLMSPHMRQQRQSSVPNSTLWSRSQNTTSCIHEGTDQGQSRDLPVYYTIHWCTAIFRGVDFRLRELSFVLCASWRNKQDLATSLIRKSLLRSVLSRPKQESSQMIEDIAIATSLPQNQELTPVELKGEIAE